MARKKRNVILILADMITPPLPYLCVPSDMEPENKDEKSEDHYMYEGEEYILNPEESKGGR